jgi:hypothetical protein
MLFMRRLFLFTGGLGMLLTACTLTTDAGQVAVQPTNPSTNTSQQTVVALSTTIADIAPGTTTPAPATHLPTATVAVRNQAPPPPATLPATSAPPANWKPFAPRASRNFDVCDITPRSGQVNIRDGGGTSYPVIGVLKPGEFLQAWGHSADDWWQVGALETGYGWVWGGVVEVGGPCGLPAAVGGPAPTTFPSFRVIDAEPLPGCFARAGGGVATVTVYEQPSESTSITGSLPANEDWAVVGRTSNNWYFVQRSAADRAQGAGFVSSAQVTLVGSCTPMRALCGRDYTDQPQPCL